jgi:hypothetical protein
VDKEERKTLVSARDAAQTKEYVENTKGHTMSSLSVSAMKDLDNEIDQIGRDEEEEYDEDEIALVNQYQSRVGKRPYHRGGF